MKTRVLFLTLSGLAFLPACSTIPAAPVAQPQVVQDKYFNTTLDDPFRYLEKVKDEPAASWYKGQADHTRAVLDSIPGRKVLLDRLLQLSNSSPTRVTDVSEVPGRIFYEARKTGANQFNLYTRTGWDGPEQLLLDPTTIKSAEGEPMAINFLQPSPHGRYVAVGVSPGGSENASIRVIETATGKDLGINIAGARFGAIAWRDDESGFFYNQLKQRPANADPTLLYQDSQVRYHPMGADIDKDTFVFGTGAPGAPAMASDKIPFFNLYYGDPRVFAVVADGVEKEITLYVATLESIDSGKPVWRKLFDFTDNVIDFSPHDDDLYVLTHTDAPRFKFLHTKVSNPDLTKADIVIAPGEPVLESLATAHDAVYVISLDGGIEHLQRVPFTSGAKAESIDLPLKGSVSDPTTNTLIDGIVMHLTSWTDTGGYYAYDPATGKTTDTNLQPRGPYDQPSDLVEEEVRVKSRDGVMIPLSIIHKKGIKLDGTNPCWLEAYGAYGIVDTPYYSPAYLAWYELGGIHAVAHVRGGGAFGEEWHLAGQKQTKPNTWKDLIACSEWLINNNYTSTSKLGINGGSAGGVTVGRAMTERPDLFGAVVGDVGMFNTVRFETDSNGVTNVSEFGTVANQPDFRSLLEMDSYQHVVDGVKYPPVLLTTGINDPRVPPWMPGKFAARLQQAGDPVVLLRVDYEAGHGYGSTRAQVLGELADTFAFYLWQFGVPGFQP